jgi:hypothetical protein
MLVADTPGHVKHLEASFFKEQVAQVEWQKAKKVQRFDPA